MVIHFYTVVLARLTGLLCFQLDFTMRKPIRGVAGWCARATHQAGGCGGDDPRGPRPCQGWPVTDEKQTLGFSKPNPSVRDMTIGVWNREAKFIWWYKQALSPHFPSFCFILSDWNGRGLGAQFPPVAGQLRSWRILCLEEGWGWEDDRNFKRNQPWYHWYHICGGFHRWGYPRYSKMDGL